MERQVDRWINIQEIKEIEKTRKITKEMNKEKNKFC